MSDNEDAAAAPAKPAHSSYVRLFAVAGLAVLLLVAITGSALALNASVQSKYEEKDDAFRALAIRTDTDKRKTANATTRTAAAAVVAQEKAVTTAVKAEKRRAERVVRRVVRKMKVSARRKIDEAYKKGQSAGYSSGSAAGYSSGKDEGFYDGFDSAFDFCYVDDGYIC
jgi:hypothetical protein